MSLEVMPKLQKAISAAENVPLYGPCAPIDPLRSSAQCYEKASALTLNFEELLCICLPHLWVPKCRWARHWILNTHQLSAAQEIERFLPLASKWIRTKFTKQNSQIWDAAAALIRAALVFAETESEPLPLNIDASDIPLKISLKKR